MNGVFRYYSSNLSPEFKEYAKQQYELAKKLNFKKGIGQGLFNYGNYFYHREESDSAKFYYSRALKVFKDMDYAKGVDFARSLLARTARYYDDYDTALDVVSDNIDYFKKVKDTKNIASSYYDEASLHFKHSNYKLALEKNLKALRLFEQIKDTSYHAPLYFNLSNIELYSDNYEKALEYKLKNLRYLNKKNKRPFASSYNGLGNIYLKLKDYKKADSLYNIGYTLATEIKWTYLQKLILGNHCESYLDRNDYVNALKKAETYIEIEKNNPNDIESSRGLQLMGSVLANLNRLEEAKTYLDKALPLAKKENYRPRTISIYETLTNVNAKLNHYKEAYEDHVILTTMQDSIYNEKKSEQIEKMRATFDTEKKEQQIAQQETEISLLEEKEKTSRLQKIALGSGLGLSALALGFGFYGFRQKTKRNKLEKEKVEAELEFKKKELTTHALQLAKKNETLENLKQKANELKSSEVHNGYQQLITAINFDLQDDNNWENFSRYFEEVHKDFNSNVAKKYSDITPNELRLMALLKMNLSSKEIANILNISSNGIKKARQRLRKKMHLSTTESLESAVLSI